MDAKYGYNNWRPFPRFPIKQGEKWRAIDDGKASGLNSAAQAWVRIHTVEPAWIAAVARAFMEHLPQLQQIAFAVASALALKGGTDDESSAYRWKLVKLLHRCFNIAAFFNYKINSMEYLELLGNPFGASAGPINYNRSPELQVAAARQLCFTITTHFFDDALSLGLSFEGNSPQLAYRLIASLAGAVFDDDKHQTMSERFLFTGIVCDTSSLFDAESLLFAPKEGRQDKIESIILKAEDCKSFPSSAAASLRGQTGFLGSTLTGRVLRGCEYTLIKRQYSDEHAVDSDIKYTFAFIRAAMSILPFKRIRIPSLVNTVSPLLCWSDAEYQDERPMGFGFIIAAQWLAAPIAAWGVIPDTISCQLQDRKT